MIRTILRGGTIWLVLVAYKVVVVIAFYGYARQAVSIAPVLFVLTALTIDALGKRLRTQAWSQRRGVRWSAAGLLCALLLHAAWDAARPPTWTVRGLRPNATITPTPKWGADAFESFDDLLLEARP